MEYRKHLETKIIRTQHHILIRVGGSAGGLKDAIRHIPDDACLVDEDEEDGNTILIFQKEQNEVA